MKIFGAGLAGLLAGCHFQTAEIFEAGPENKVEHKAVLRFRSSAVGDSVGIPFRKVRVHKGLWWGGTVPLPDIRLANWYSLKVIGRLADRSIWNLEPSDRYIAPEDFQLQLAQRCGSRIHWQTPVTLKDFAGDEPKVSTMPMGVVAKWTGHESGEIEFKHSPITVRRWRVPCADVFQTIYFPDPRIRLYRASITGNLITAEFVEDSEHAGVDSCDEQIFQAFGIHRYHASEIESVHRQSYGKISPINDDWRKSYIKRLSDLYNVFSLGRFATWRNILLDDVLHDIGVVRKLMTVSGYDRARIAAK